MMTPHSLLLATLTLLAVVLTTGSADVAPLNDPVTLKFLFDFKAGFPGQLKSWKWPGYYHSGWEGIIIDPRNSSCVTLYLTDLGLRGTIPDNVDKDARPCITSIYLDKNPGIVGSFPTTWAYLDLKPPGEISLSHTSLSGPIPDAWGANDGLQAVSVSHTNACGNMPNWQTKSLTSASFTNNHLRGTLSAVWPPDALVLLDGNDFCGCVPVTWRESERLMRSAPKANQADDCSTARPCTDVCRVRTGDGDLGTAQFSFTLATVVALLGVVLAVA